MVVAVFAGGKNHDEDGDSQGHGSIDKVRRERFLWDYSGLLFSNIGLIPLRAVAAAMTARILGGEGYGTIALYGSIVSLVTMFTANWTVASVLRFGREEYDQRGHLSGTFWARNMILVPCQLLGVLLLILFSGPISRYMGLPRWTVGLLVASSCVIIVYNYLEYILQAIHRVRPYALLQIIGILVSIVGLSLMFFKLVRGDALTVIILGIISGGVTIFIGLLWVPARIFLPFELCRRTVREMMLFSYPLILGSVASYVVSWADVFVINQYFSRSAVGTYQLGYQMFTCVLGMIMTVNIVRAPILVSFRANGRELIANYASRIVPQGVYFGPWWWGLG